jgi:amidophosphoribosyltransferase
MNVVLKKCIDQENAAKESVKNYVRDVYSPFTVEEISAKIAELVTPEGTRAKVEVLFQTIEGLHDACPANTGDWYFTGHYPTPGGNKVVNKAFINFMQGKNVRAY